MKPAPALLDKLSRSRLLPRFAAASVGSGERPSKAKGSGMEFADHRAYQPGDDLRHLDPHLYARLGESFIRQYEVHRQLPITIVVDASRSMTVGEGERYKYALNLAALIGFVGLAGGDQVRFAIGRNAKVEWSQRFHGVSRAGAAFEWLDRPREEDGSFEGCLAAVGRDLPKEGLVIVVSDWWDLHERDIGILAAMGQEVWAVHVVTPEEVDPSLLGEGETRFIDAETGEEVELNLDRSVLDQFQRSVTAWRDQVRSACESARGRYLMVEVGSRLETLLLQDWRRAGFLT